MSQDLRQTATPGAGGDVRPIVAAAVSRAGGDAAPAPDGTRPQVFFSTGDPKS